ncbi:MAG: hypothetical protein LBS91_03990 [Clostridiales Family XIII bacterium]|jgi:A/G-specific adenine glycosylase|nr:hypothetical protein [Clostridiales Family XIII bacterium]
MSAKNFKMDSAIPGLLISWHGQNARGLPWRRDPCRVWLSEIMLQQARIETAIPYYERFLTALTTVHALAECGEERLLKLWEGFGYYSRARNLHKAAKIVAASVNAILFAQSAAP